MARTSTQQSTMFPRRQVPRMPEGYYSSGPNPNLRRFVEEHATPYDPASDDYDARPFGTPITTSRSTPVFLMHTYWSKKPHDAIQQYIRHYTKPGDLVLDPFCGSGSTALAALMEGRTAIAIDLSPAATFITKGYCTPVNLAGLRAAFAELEKKVAPEMNWLYETRCDGCGGRASTNYTVYSQTYQCPRCLEIVPLSDCIEVDLQTSTGVRKVTVCPNCHNRAHDEEISTRGERHGWIPVEVSYDCLEGCRPKRRSRRYNDADERKRQHFLQHDLALLSRAESSANPHWVPDSPFPTDFARWQTDLRGLAIESVAQLYTARNLRAVAAIMEGINALTCPDSAKDALSFVLTSIMLKASRMMAHNSDGAGRILKGTYYVPPLGHDINVWNFMVNSLGYFLRGYEIIDGIRTNLLLVSTEDATRASLAPESMDYIFTDPPYSGTVQYGELNFVWESWLGFDTTWHDSEITVNQPRGLNESDWYRMMKEAMTVCYRALKPGRWLSLCYHDTSEGTWQMIQDIMAEAGFLSEDVEQALYIQTNAKTPNQLFGSKVTKRDLVINFRKPRPGELDGLILTGQEDDRTFRQIATAILHLVLEAHPGSTSDRLYDELVSRMVRSGRFERHDFDALLRSVAEDPRGDNHWYLKDTADAADQAEIEIADAAAARLEQFVRRYLKENPAHAGVHYSDLFEHYLPVSPKPRPKLADWLPEYFVRTPEGTWRPPLTSEERSQLAALRSSGTLRRIKRYANALAEGVPPAERDRPENVATAADWLRQCRRAGLYAQGRALYERGGFSFSALGEVEQLEVEEDYRLCMRGSVA